MMEFINKFVSILFSTSGRLSRKVYNVVTLVGFLIPTFLIIVDVKLLDRNENILTGTMLFLALFLCWWSLIGRVKRVHDFNQPAWAAFVVNGYKYSTFVTPGTKGSNKYGPDPLQKTLK